MMLLDLLTGERREPAECIIRVDGTEITQLYPFLVEVTVDTAREEATEATLHFETHRDEQGLWAVQDEELLRPWRFIVIEAAFGHTVEEVMRGYIREVRAEYPVDRDATVTVIGQDESIVMDRQHRRQVWGADIPTSDAVVIPKIIGRYGLLPHRDNAQGQKGLVLYQDHTDITFLKQRAEANGYELIVSRGQVYFGPMRLEAEPQVTLLVYAGEDSHCFDFSVYFDGHLPDQVAVDVIEGPQNRVSRRVIRSALPLLGARPADSMDLGLPAFAWQSQEGCPDEPERRVTVARKKADEAAMKLRAEGELDGSRYGHVLRVGEPVPVDGIGERFEGEYYVDKVSHRFNHEGYRQRFTLLRNAYGSNLKGGLSNALVDII